MPVVSRMRDTPCDAAAWMGGGQCGVAKARAARSYTAAGAHDGADAWPTCSMQAMSSDSALPAASAADGRCNANAACIDSSTTRMRACHSPSEVLLGEAASRDDSCAAAVAADGTGGKDASAVPRRSVG